MIENILKLIEESNYGSSHSNQVFNRDKFNNSVTKIVLEYLQLKSELPVITYRNPSLFETDDWSEIKDDKILSKSQSRRIAIQKKSNKRKD